MIYYFYKIVCDDLPDYVYVGSTMAFTNRKYQHKIACENINSQKHNYKIYQTIRANGGWDNWKMICIHQQDVENKRMAEKIEEDFRLELKANMNTYRAFTTEEDKKEYLKEYRENNKEKIKEQVKEYCKEYRENNKEKIKEQVKEYGKEWRENNREHIRQHACEKITCDCGCQIRRCNLARHKKSNRHIKLMQNI